VRIDARTHETRDLDPVAAELARQIGNDAGGGDDAQLPVAGGATLGDVAGGERESDERGGGVASEQVYVLKSFMNAHKTAGSRKSK
jgi:hypothetical protein